MSVGLSFYNRCNIEVLVRVEPRLYEPYGRHTISSDNQGGSDERRCVGYQLLLFFQMLEI